MRRLLLYVLLIWFACASSVVICVILGRLQPPPEVFKALHIDDCNGVPCVQGVIPGVTSWAEVKSRFAPLPGSQPLPYFINTSLDTAVYAVFVGNETMERVDGITVDTYDPTPNLTVGTVLTRYGSPCKVQVLTTGSFKFVYPLFTAIIYVPKNIPREITTFNSELIVTNVTFYSTANSCSLDATLNMDLDHYDVKWLGLAILTKYYYPHQIDKTK